MKDWKHLTFEQRKVISNGISHNYKLKEIAKTLGFDPTSISKEVKRNRESITIGLNMTENLVIEAFTKALINRGLNKDGIFHSDRGSQYTSNNFEQLLTDLNLKHSYSKKVIPMITQVWKASMPY